MAGKKGEYTRPTEWAKHLRPRGKKAYWASERIAAKKAINKNRYANPEE